MSGLHTEHTTLIQCIEYDWCVVATCPACRHTRRWGAVALVEGFRTGLRANLGQFRDKLADHCDQRPSVYNLQGAGMELWTLEEFGDVKDWAFRDQRLRRFCAQHGLPMALADERKAIADACLAAHRPQGPYSSDD